jgi:cytochrome c peroxidase
VTNAARTISLWRGVPSVRNVAITAPYLYDGRAPTLQAQALGALQGHGQVSKPPPMAILDQIAAFERSVFSSPGVAAVAQALANGTPPPDPDPYFAPGSPEAAGKAVFNAKCASCHGGATGNKLQDPTIAQALLSAMNLPSSVSCSPQPDADGSTFYLNIGSSLFTFLAQTHNLGVDMPHYRLRFYTDATRTKALVDLPNQAGFTTDAGRALITGNPCDFEAFKIPQLRGMSQTAPYLHDNFAPDIPTVLDFYSRLVLLKLGFPMVNPDAVNAPPEALTPDDKANLLAYLQKI